MTDNVKNDLLILYSGGADSRLLLEMALKMKYNPYCLFIDYKQLIKESEYPKCFKTLTDLKVDNSFVKIQGLDIESGLTGRGTKGLYENVHEMYVPRRNTFFLSIASSVAENLGIETIWIGPDWSDYLGEFPDCKQVFIDRFNKLSEVNGSSKIIVEAPLMGFTKSMVIKMLDSLNVSKDEYFSGYGDL